jgi:hypothetical protein
MEKEKRFVIKKGVLTEALIQGKTLITEEKVDNFDTVSKILKMDYKDPIIYIEILKRWKDNKGASDIKNRYYRLVRPFFFKSIDELMSAKQQIVDLCMKHNARAYIWLNTRSADGLNQYVSQLEQRHEKTKHNYMITAARGSWNTPKRSLVLIDVDSTDTKVHNDVLDILNNQGFTVALKYISPSGGLHIVVDDKRAIHIPWDRYGYGKGKYAIVGSEIDKPGILFADLTTDFSYDDYKYKRMKSGVPNK